MKLTTTTPWTPTQTAQAIDMRRRGNSLDEIAAKLGRSKCSVQFRLMRLRKSGVDIRLPQQEKEMARTYVTDEQIIQYLDEHPQATIEDASGFLCACKERVRAVIRERNSRRKGRKELMYVLDGVSYRLPAERLPVGGSFVVEVVS